jgi:hypothetical protein
LSDYANDPATISSLNDSDPLAEYERYLSLELPRRVRDRLEVAILGASEPLESQIRSQLVEIVRTCQSELFQSYQQAARPQPSTPDGQMGPHNLNRSLGPPILAADMTFAFDMSAWADTPSLLDPELQLPLDVSLLQSSAMHENFNFANLADSGYGSLQLNASDGMSSFGTLSTKNHSFDWFHARSQHTGSSGPPNSSQ